MSFSCINFNGIWYPTTIFLQKMSFLTIYIVLTCFPNIDQIMLFSTLKNDNCTKIEVPENSSIFVVNFVIFCTKWTITQFVIYKVLWFLSLFVFCAIKICQRRIKLLLFWHGFRTITVHDVKTCRFRAWSTNKLFKFLQILSGRPAKICHFSCMFPKTWQNHVIFDIKSVIFMYKF